MFDIFIMALIYILAILAVLLAILHLSNKQNRYIQATLQQARAAISPSYLKSLSPTDLAVRGWTSGHPPSPIPFTSLEWATLYNILLPQADALISRYPILHSQPWILAKSDAEIVLNATGDSPRDPQSPYGLAHTHSNIIYLPSRFFKWGRNEQMRVLIHEKIHVLTRTHRALFEPLYAAWGFTPYARSPPLNTRANPDIDIPYAFNNLLLAEFYNPHPASILDTSTKLLDPDGTPHPISIMQLPPQIKDRDHPNEILADLWSLHITGQLKRGTIDEERWMDILEHFLLTQLPKN